MNYKTWEDYLGEQLASIDEKNARRSLRLVDGAQGSRVVIDGKKVLNFCSNNYLGLADDPRIVAAAQEAMQIEGWGAGASRLVCGNLTSHELLENELAQFKNAPAALTFNSGFMANVGIIPALYGRDDIIFWDRLNHASLIDGILLSGAEHKRYPHNDIAALEELLQKSFNSRRRVIITDSVFSMDGDIAPLDRIVALAKQYQCDVMIDEAHAFGVLGKNGRGLAEHFGVEKDIQIQMGTLSKAAGSYGAYVCGSQALKDVLINKARSFIYTTGLPPAVAAASRAAIAVMKSEPQRREMLWSNTKYISDAIKSMGFDMLQSTTPIIPLVVGDANLALDFSRHLFEAGIWISAIRPPTVPEKSARLRLTVMATHTRDDLDFVLEQLHKIGRKLCLIG